MSDVTTETYNATVDRYIERTTGRTVGAFLDRIVDRVGHGRVLEIGSGPGWDADYLETCGLTVDRTDAAVGFVERMRDEGRDARVVDVRVDDLGGPYDGVIALAVFPHIDRGDLVGVLRRCREAVRDGGVLAFTVKEGDGDEWTDAKLGGWRHFTYWREPALREVVAAAGWQVESVGRHVGATVTWLEVVAANV